MDAKQSDGELADSTVPLAVLMISFNEEHNMEAVLDNLSGFASEIFLVDNFSSDGTVGLALKCGVYVVQRRFHGFGDQWNFAIRDLPITASWTMKLDPDERLTEKLKDSIHAAILAGKADGLIIRRRLWFMGQPLPIKQPILRVWRTGECRFSDVTVNEHPIVEGRIVEVAGDLEHHDSPNLHHWFDKQNRYTTAEALAAHTNAKLAAEPKPFGSALERRMWLKKHFHRIPFRFPLLFLYHLIGLGAWRAGRVGWAWARLRIEVSRMVHLKTREMELSQEPYGLPEVPCGQPHPGAHQADQ